MHSFKQVWTGVFCLSLVAFFATGPMAQTTPEKSKEKNTETEIIIIEESVDKNGKKTIKKTITKGTDMTDEELEKYLKEQVGGEFDIESIIVDGEQQITIDAIESDESRPYLGIYLDDTGEGVRISRIIEGGAAESSGLKSGDVIIAIDGTETPGGDELVDVISKHDPGDEIEVVYLRDGKKETTNAKLTSKSAVDSEVIEKRIEKIYKDSEGLHEHHKREHPNHRLHEGIEKPRLGVRVSDSEQGVLVEGVESDSRADALGLMEGDVITHFNNSETKSADELIEAVRKAEAGKSMTIKFQRDGKTMKKKVQFD